MAQSSNGNGIAIINPSNSIANGPTHRGAILSSSSSSSSLSSSSSPSSPPSSSKSAAALLISSSQPQMSAPSSSSASSLLSGGSMHSSSHHTASNNDGDVQLLGHPINSSSSDNNTSNIGNISNITSISSNGLTSNSSGGGGSPLSSSFSLLNAKQYYGTLMLLRYTMAAHIGRFFSPLVYSYFVSGTDFVTFCYMAVTLPLYFVSFISTKWFIFHLLVLVLIPCVRLYAFKHRHRHFLIDWLIELYPIIIFFLLYTEVAVLNKTLHRGILFDDAIVRVEESMFRSSPAQDLHKWLPWRMLGEYLHFCYFSLYLIIPSLPLVLFFTRDRLTFYKGSGTLCLTFYIGFLFYILIPVEGPYWRYVPPKADDVGYMFSHIMHAIVAGGSASGTAFPSSHVGISVSCWILAMRHHPPLAKVYTLFVPGLVVSTVYGGFHYAIDALAGLAMGIFAATVGHWFICEVLIRVIEQRPDWAAFEDGNSTLPIITGYGNSGSSKKVSER